MTCGGSLVDVPLTWRPTDDTGDAVTAASRAFQRWKVGVVVGPFTDVLITARARAPARHLAEAGGLRRA